MRKLTPKTSLGFSVIEFATTMLLIELLPWQKWLLIHALELRPDGTLRFRNVVVLVARQNGKSTLSQVLALWWLYVCGVRLVLGTAQDLDTAEEVWQAAVDLVQEQNEDDEYVRPELAELVAKVVQVNGKKSLNLSTGERYKTKAANRRAGRGFSGDRIVLDELREHQDWLSWAAITKTTMARPDAQVWCFSNAGDVTSVVLSALRKIGHRALGDPDGICQSDEVSEYADEPNDVLLDELEHLDDFDEDDLGIFEWSADPGCDLWAREAWAQANPSLGYTIQARTIASAARTDPEWVFRTEVLCQWPDGSLEGPFPAGAWAECAAATDSRGDLPATQRIDVTKPLMMALDVSWNRSTSYIVGAGHRADGLPQVELSARSAGTEWVVDWFTDPRHPERLKRPVVIQVGSPAWSLAEDLTAAKVSVIEWHGPGLKTAWSDFYDRVVAQKIRHLSQPPLNLAAATGVTKALGDVIVLDRRKSPHDVAPLVAAVGALWGLKHPPGEKRLPPPPPKRSIVPVRHELEDVNF